MEQQKVTPRNLLVALACGQQQKAGFRSHRSLRRTKVAACCTVLYAAALRLDEESKKGGWGGGGGHLTARGLAMPL